MKFDQEGDVNFQLDKILNEGLELNENFRGALIEVALVFGETTVQHGLGFIPIGYLVIFSEAAVTISGSRVADWTTEKMFLNSSAASPVVRLFVM